MPQSFYDPNTFTLAQRVRLLCKLCCISYRAAFNKNDANKSYAVLEVVNHGTSIDRDGAMTGSPYGLYLLFHTQQQLMLQCIRDHEGSSATLEHARSIINNQD